MAFAHEKVAQITAAGRQPDYMANVQRVADRQDLERQLTRRWTEGDVYAPHDLSGEEMAKFKKSQKKGRPKKDALDMLRINPLHHYKVHCGMLMLQELGSGER